MPFGEHMLTRVAALMTRGIGEVRLPQLGEGRQRGRAARFRASALRHMMQWQAGEADEDHAAAVIFNLIAAITTEWKLNTAMERLTDKNIKILEGR